MASSPERASSIAKPQALRVARSARRIAGSSSTTRALTRLEFMQRFALECRQPHTEGRVFALGRLTIEFQTPSVCHHDPACKVKSQPRSRRGVFDSRSAIETLEDALALFGWYRNSFTGYPNAGEGFAAFQAHPHDTVGGGVFQRVIQQLH